MNSTLILLCIIWTCATIATCVTKSSDSVFLAFAATVLIGFGYLLMHAH